MGAALDLVRQFFEAFGEGDLQKADDVFADDCTFILPVGTMSKSEHRMMGEGFKSAMPYATIEIDHAIDNGDEVFVEGHFHGTHTGDLVSPQGTLPPTGNKIELRYGEYFRSSGGRIVEHRSYWDQVDFMTQLTGGHS